MPANTMTSVATIRTPVIATASVEPAGASAPDAAFAISSARSAARRRVSRSPSPRASAASTSARSRSLPSRPCRSDAERDASGRPKHSPSNGETSWTIQVDRAHGFASREGCPITSSRRRSRGVRASRSSSGRSRRTSPSCTWRMAAPTERRSSSPTPKEDTFAAKTGAGECGPLHLSPLAFPTSDRTTSATRAQHS